MPDIVLGLVDGGSARLNGYIARPVGTGPWPGVVVIQEVWGLDDVMRRHCDRLASIGYLALAPNLYSDGGALRCLVATFKAMASGKGKAFVDIEAARRRLLAETDCTGKVGIIGFCIGGAFALLASTRGFDAASDNYGVLPPGFEEIFQGACPIIASYGGKDPLLPRNTTERLEKALTAAGVEHEVNSYPGAGHQFFNDMANGPMILRPLLKVTNAGPNPDAATQAWKRIGEVFGRHLH